MRGVLAGMRARNHGHAPRAATMLPGAEAMPISFCNMVPAGPHVQDESIVSRPVIRMLPRCSCWYTKRKVLHGGGPAAVRTQLGSPRTARSCALPYLRARLSLQRFFRRFFVFRGKLPLSQKLMDIGLLTRKLVILARYVFERSNVDTPGSTAGSGPSRTSVSGVIYVRPQAPRTGRQCRQATTGAREEPQAAAPDDRRQQPPRLLGTAARARVAHNRQSKPASTRISVSAALMPRQKRPRTCPADPPVQVLLIVCLKQREGGREGERRRERERVCVCVCVW